jgi:Transposase, Mutator family
MRSHLIARHAQRVLAGEGAVPVGSQAVRNLRQSLYDEAMGKDAPPVHPHPAGKPIIPDRVTWLHSEMLKTRVAHGHCSSDQACRACPYANICEACDESRIKERLNREIRRRTDVVGIFSGRDSLIRLVGAVLAEQYDEWTEGRRYLGLDVLSGSRITPVPAAIPPTEVNPASDLQALSA